MYNERQQDVLARHSTRSKLLCPLPPPFDIPWFLSLQRDEDVEDRPQRPAHQKRQQERAGEYPSPQQLPSIACFALLSCDRVVGHAACRQNTSPIPFPKHCGLTYLRACLCQVSRLLQLWLQARLVATPAPHRTGRHASTLCYNYLMTTQLQTACDGSRLFLTGGTSSMPYLHRQLQGSHRTRCG